MPVTRHPPHRSRRAARPHRAPASGDDAQAYSACRPPSRACDRVTRRWVRPLGCATRFPWASPLLSTPSAGAGAPAPLCGGFADTLELSDSLHPSITVVPRGFPGRTWPHSARPDAGPPGFRTPCICACQRAPTPPGACTPCHTGAPAIACRVFGARRHPGKRDCGAQYSACTFLCQRFVPPVTERHA